ncbi:MAG: hypothetical protein LBC21_00605 [Oscillospiraceae bacterium]|nr:hypothetical protein [Oscillospiraceae bacterium]
MAQYNATFDTAPRAEFRRIGAALDECRIKLLSAANALDDVDGGLLGCIDEATGDRLLNLRGETSMAPMANAVRGIASTLPGVADRLRGEGNVYEAAVQRYKQAETGTCTGFTSVVLQILSAIVNAINAIAEHPTQPGQTGQPEQPGQVAQPPSVASGSVPSPDAAFLKQLDDFKTWVLDKNNWTDKAGGAAGGIDVDNAFGEQCADISKKWYMTMYGVSSVGLSAYDDAGKTPMVNFKAKNTMADVSGGPYAAGDIGFKIGKSGHTFVIMSNPDANGMVQILEQNPSSPRLSTMHISEITNGYRKK